MRRPRLLQSARKIHKPSRRIGDASNRLCPLPIQAMNGRYIKQVMLLGQDAYQGITPVTTPGVYGQTRRLVDHHNVIAFMDDRDRSGSHGRLVPVHVVRDDVPVAAKNGSRSVLLSGSRRLTAHWWCVMTSPSPPRMEEYITRSQNDLCRSGYCRPSTEYEMI